VRIVFYISSSNSPFALVYQSSSDIVTFEPPSCRIYSCPSYVRQAIEHDPAFFPFPKISSLEYVEQVISNIQQSRPGSHCILFPISPTFATLGLSVHLLLIFLSRDTKNDLDTHHDTRYCSILTDHYINSIGCDQLTHRIKLSFAHRSCLHFKLQATIMMVCITFWN
jgi:hypothetical protein